MRDFKTLQVWEKAHQLTLPVYKETARFPAREQYGLTRQMRRSAASIPVNVAEGCGRETNAEMTRFLHIAAGSSTELEYHLLLAHDLGFLDPEVYRALHARVTEVQRILTAFIRGLKK